ncbi:MAG: glycosyltransferase family 4 protein [Sulfuriferula sp.]
MGAQQKLLLVSARWDHLGGHSGLAPLGKHLEQHFEVRRVVPNVIDKIRVNMQIAWGMLRERLFGTPRRRGWNPFYNRHGLLLETAARRMAQAQHFDVIFFEALEDHFDAFADARQWLKRTQVAGVSHQPPAWWRLYASRSSVFAAVDMVIALSRPAQAYLQQAGHANVQFVPHGVDAEFFTMNTPRELAVDAPVEVLFCGQWLRDFQQLSETLEVLESAPRRYVFHLVVPRFARNFEQHYRLAQHDNVHWYAGVTDAELRDLYRRAHLLFLPLIDATANNSVLEAMACGLPMVVSRIGGVVDYVNEDDAVFLTAKHGQHAVDKLAWSVDNYVECVTRSERARTRTVSQLAWPVIAARLAELLGAI